MSIINRLKETFSRKEGKSVLQRWDDPNDRQMVKAKRVMSVSAVGAASGAAVGAVAGFAMAQRAINNVPIQEKTVDYRLPNIESQEVGRMPSDFFQPVGQGQPNTGGRPLNVPVMRDNPIYRGDGTPDTRPATQTFRGHGTPTVHWDRHDVVHHKMNGSTPSVSERTHQEYDHTERWTEQVPYEVPYTVTESVPHQAPYTEYETRTVQVPHTVYDTQSVPRTECVDSYNSNGSTTQDCRTTYETETVSRTEYTTETRTEPVTRYRTEYRDEQVTKYRTEYRTEERSRDVYRTILDGWDVNYRPNIQDRVVGSYDTPRVSFDHGISVGSYIGKGILIGAVIGAVGLGVMAAIEDKHFHLPGWEELPPEPAAKPEEPAAPKPPGPGPDPVQPKPPVGPKPSPDPAQPSPDPAQPKPPAPKPPAPEPEPPKDYGGYKKHAHNGQWHGHDGGDRWHYHGCPSDSDVLANPANMDWICFKPEQVPSGYDLSEGKQCPENGSICFVQKGRKG